VAYCVDGGVLHSMFTLGDVVGAVLAGQIKDNSSLETVRRAIDYMLYLVIGDEPYKFDPFHSKVRNLLSATKFAFNVPVMIKLIEYDYTQRELELSGDSNLYPKFLAYVLRMEENLELKAAVCREVIKIKEESKS
jgi:hypothetical protein